MRSFLGRDILSLKDFERQEFSRVFETAEKLEPIARNRKNAEFSVVVADRWQGKGIGAELLRRCLAIAREQKIETVRGTVLSENTQMLALGKKLGFTIEKVRGANEYELRLSLTEG